MKELKKAGHLIDAHIALSYDCVVAIGDLFEDPLCTDHEGNTRDSNLEEGDLLCTSWLERVEYVPSTDTTVIHSRDSIYFAPGNILEPAFGKGVLYAEGKAELRQMFVDNLKVKKPNVCPNKVYELTHSGYMKINEPMGTHLVYRGDFDDHPFCGYEERAFSRPEHRNSRSIMEIFFLTSTMIKPTTLH